jgi:hypothetical protein
MMGDKVSFSLLDLFPTDVTSSSETLVEEQVQTENTNQGPWDSGVFTGNTDNVGGLRRSSRVRTLNPRYTHVATIIDDIKEPNTFEEANAKQKYKLAMKEKTDALLRKKTWDLLPQPNDVKPISFKWVYKVRFKSDGSVERCKARLVACGFS